MNIEIIYKSTNPPPACSTGSKLAIKKGISVLNTPGTIDADYRGEIGNNPVNLSNKTSVVDHGECGSGNTGIK